MAMDIIAEGVMATADRINLATSCNDIVYNKNSIKKRNIMNDDVCGKHDDYNKVIPTMVMPMKV